VGAAEVGGAAQRGAGARPAMPFGLTPTDAGHQAARALVLLKTGAAATVPAERARIVAGPAVWRRGAGAVPRLPFDERGEFEVKWARESTQHMARVLILLGLLLQGGGALAGTLGPPVVLKRFEIRLPKGWSREVLSEGEILYACNRAKDCSEPTGGLPRRGAVVVRILPESAISPAPSEAGARGVIDLVWIRTARRVVAVPMPGRAGGEERECIVAEVPSALPGGASFWQLWFGLRIGSARFLASAATSWESISAVPMTRVVKVIAAGDGTFTANFKKPH